MKECKYCQCELGEKIGRFLVSDYKTFEIMKFCSLECLMRYLNEIYYK